ncbi:uncharacterized protein [Antedon mediterranea]|uniref:uncharacterized protein isoform X2 n=1 Tax=Antedon mediterranea TaxID=105859 RepID=UPI003AF5EBE6
MLIELIQLRKTKKVLQGLANSITNTPSSATISNSSSELSTTTTTSHAASTSRPSSRSTLSSSASTSSTPSRDQSIASEHRRLFNRNYRQTPYNRGHSNNSTSSKPSGKGRTLTRFLVCLMEHKMETVPTVAQRRKLKDNGYGEKKIVFPAEGNQDDFCNLVFKTFPLLANCGGFEITTGDRKKLIVVHYGPCKVQDLRTFGSGKLYIRPLQRDIPEAEIPLVEAREKCLNCRANISMKNMKVHIKYCMNEDSSSDSDLEPGLHEVPATETIPATEPIPASENLEQNRTEQNLDLEIVENIFVNEPERNEREPALTTIETIVKDTVNYCNTHNINGNPVEVLRYYQKAIVSGRPLEIEDEAEVIEGETNFIMINREDVLATAFSEIRDMADYRKTLEVQFYDERAADYGGPRKEFFVLALRAIKDGYFDNGMKEHVPEEYYYIGIIMAMSIVQNGKLPQFMHSDLIDELVNSSAPSECITNLRKGLAKLGIYQLCCHIPTFVHLFRPSPAALLSVKKMKELLKPSFKGSDGSNTKIFESSVYAQFLDYVREVASGRRGHLTLGHLLQFVTGTDEEPVLGFVLHPQIVFTETAGSFLPSANTCINSMQLPRPGLTCSLPPKDTLFNMYDLAFSQQFFGNV